MKLKKRDQIKYDAIAHLSDHLVAIGYKKFRKHNISMSSRKSAFGIIPHETFIGFTTRMLIGIEYDELVLEDNEIKKESLIITSLYNTNFLANLSSK